MEEQKRLFLAIGISFLIIFAWSTFFGPKTPKTPPETATETTQTGTTSTTQGQQQAATPQAGSTTTATMPSETGTAVAPEPIASPGAGQAARSITVDTPLYRMTLSEQGGGVTGIVLKNYREAIEMDSALKELIHKETAGGTLLVSLGANSGVDLEKALFTSDSVQEIVEVQSSEQTIRFQHKASNGLTVEKSYTFKPDSYLLDLKVSVYNGSGNPFQGSLAVGLRNSLGKDAGKISFEGTSGLVNGKLEQVKEKKYDEHNRFNGNIGWVAIEDRYFMTSIVPAKDFSGSMQLSVEKIVQPNQEIVKIFKNQVVMPIEELSPQQSATFESQVFMGPKSLELLRSFDNDLSKAINFGMFDFLAKPCLWFMNKIYGVIPNYGIAIIILTIVTRAAFWPLAKKSYKSMGEMRKIQPLMQEIREKYKDDKQRMNQETMTLYRTYKINPLGGCLPMLIQLPVFFALYKMLYSAIELRHAPFFGWITDLAAPDRLIHFGFDIPYMENPDGIPVLTIIMGASMLLQQKMTPTPGDPAQAKMMMFMPIIFTFIFINFSSGLVLYWLVSNLFSMAQQYYTQKQTA